MIWLVSRLRRDFGAWDRSTQVAFGIGVILLIIALVVLLISPPDARFSVLIGIVALLIILELTVLWGNRGMISAFTRAQRLYLDGDFVAARDLLETVRPRADARALTLLGNTYRQLGQLQESEVVLSEAVDKAPKHYFPIYGFGRTLLSEGRYAEAADAIRHAIELGAPPSVQVDLGEAYYRLNRTDDALTALRDAHPSDSEPQRTLMVGYLLNRLGAAPPPAPELVRAGLPYWEASAERFRETPYGKALLLDVREMMKSGDSDA